MGDLLRYNLDANTEGTDVSFAVSTTDLQDKVSIEPAFEKVDSPKAINLGFNKCQSFAQGNIDSEMIILCDDRKLGFLRYNLYTGALESQEKYEGLDANLQCHHLAHSDFLGILFLLCTKKSSGTTVMLSLKSDTKQLVSEVEIVFKQGEKALDLEVVEIEVFESKDSGVLVTNIVVYEKLRTPRILFLQSTSSKLVIQGFYRLQDGNIQRAPDDSLLHDCQLVSDTLLLTYEVDSKAVVMTYEPTPRQGNLQFIGESKSTLPFLAGGFVVLNQDRFVAVTNNKLVACTFVFQELACDSSATLELDLPTGLFHVVKEVIASKEDIYLLGFDNEGGAVTYRHKDEGAIQYVSRPASSNLQFSIIKRDVYDSSFEIQILIGPSSTIFTVLRDNILLVETSKFKDYAKETVEIKVDCFLKGKMVNSKTVKISLIQGPEYNPAISVQNLIHYTLWTQSLKSEIEHPSIMFNGNAPSVSTNDSVVSIDHVRQFLDPTWKGAPMDNIKSVTYIGDGIYVFEGSDNLQLRECKANQYKSGECSGLIFDPIQLQNKKFMAGRTYGDKIVIVSFSDLSNSTTVQILSKSGRDLSKAVYKAIVDAVAIRFLSGYVDIVMVGNFPADTDEVGHFFALRIDTNGNSRLPAEKDLLIGLPLSTHICPIELSFSSDMQTMFVTSVCGDKSKNPDNHVIMMSLNLESVYPRERIVVNNTYRIADSSKFSVCPHRQNFALVDTIQNKVTVYSESNNVFRLLQYPLDYYGYKKVISWSCDSRRNFVQLIAQRQDNSFGLLTYRIDLVDEPAKRVHSEVQLTAADPTRPVTDISSLVTYTAIEEDRFYSLMFGKSSSEFRVVHMRLNPSVLVNTKTITRSGYTTVEFKSQHPGKYQQSGTEAKLVHTFVFASPDLELKQVKLDNRQGKRVGYHEDIDLDLLAGFSSPVTRVTSSDGSFSIVPRCPKFELPVTANILWTSVRLYQDYRFGYIDSKLDGVSTVYVYKGANLQGKLSLKRILDLKILTRLGDKPLLVGQGLAEDSTGQLFIFDEGAQDFQTLPLKLRGFTKCVLNKGLGETVVTTSYNALYNQSIFIYTAVQQKTGEWKLFEGPSTLLQSIDNFDAVVASDTLVVMSQLHYNRATQIDLYKLSAPETQPDGSLVKFYKTGWMEMTGKKGRSARQPVFSCVKRNELEWGIQCVVGGPDVKELLVFTFEITPDPIKPSTVSNVILMRTLSNIWNLVPIRAVMTQNYLAVVTNNTRPKDSTSVAEDGDKPLFSAKSMILLYRLDLSPVEGIDKAVPPYMIFNPEELFDAAALQESDLLEAGFYRVEGGRGNASLKLSICAGGKLSSPEPFASSPRIKAFTLSGTTLKGKTQKAINPEAELVFEGVKYGNGTVPIFKTTLQSLVAFSASGNSPKLKILLWGVIGSLAILAMVFTLYCVLSPSSSKLSSSASNKDISTTLQDSEDSKYYSFTRG